MDEYPHGSDEYDPAQLALLHDISEDAERLINTTDAIRAYRNRGEKIAQVDTYNAEGDIWMSLAEEGVMASEADIAKTAITRTLPQRNEATNDISEMLHLVELSYLQDPGVQFVSASWQQAKYSTESERIVITKTQLHYSDDSLTAMQHTIKQIGDSSQRTTVIVTFGNTHSVSVAVGARDDPPLLQAQPAETIERADLEQLHAILSSLREVR